MLFISLGVFFLCLPFNLRAIFRNPFSFPQGEHFKKNKSELFKVIGCVKCGSQQGILVDDNHEQHVLIPGDAIQGYILQTVTSQYVEFIKNNKCKRIAIE